MDIAQHVHAVELGAGDRQPPRLGARGQQQPVVAQPLAVVELDLTVRGVESHDGAPQQQLDVVRGIEALGMDVDPLALELAAQVVLGERRPLVGSLRLGADQHDATLEAPLTQRLGGLGARQARPRDHDRLLRHHASSVLR